MGSLCSWPSTRHTVASISLYVRSSTSSFSRGSIVVLQLGRLASDQGPRVLSHWGALRLLPLTLPPPRVWTHMTFCRHSIADRKHLSLTRECLCVVGGASKVRPQSPQLCHSLLPTATWAPGHPPHPQHWLQHSPAQRAECHCGLSLLDCQVG